MKDYMASYKYPLFPGRVGPGRVDALLLLLPHDVPLPLPLPLAVPLSACRFWPFARPGYFEVDIDVGSSTLASNATHIAGGYAKNLVLDLAFALQVCCRYSMNGR